MKIRLSLFLPLLALSVLCSCINQTKHQTKNEYGNIRVVSLWGTWEEMGRQYGEAAGKELNDVFEFLKAKFINSEKEASIRAIADSLISRYPYRFKSFLEGVSQTSALSVEQLILANAVEYSEAFFCSGLSVWGDYSKGALVYGRNYDARSYRDIANDLIITAFHPSDGSLATATIGYAGELYAVNAINSYGLFLELNNGMPSAGSTIHFDMLSSTASLLEAMFDAYSLDYFDAFFKTHRSFTSFIVGVADRDQARSYEWCTAGTLRGDVTCPDGVMAMTNYYVNPLWSYPVPSDEASWLSLTRRKNLLDLAKENKGAIDAQMMCNIMSKSIEEGGSMNKYTRYQLVFEPQTMKLLVRVEAAPSWTEVDMSEILQ